MRISTRGTRALCVIAVGIVAGLFGSASRAEATPVTYDFTASLGANPSYGTGSFTFDSSLFGGPITKPNLSTFSYQDGLITPAFTLSNLNTFAFSTNSVGTPVPGSLLFQASRLNPSPFLLSINAVTGGGASQEYNQATQDQRFPILGNPIQAPSNPVPEPSTLFLVGSGLLGLAGFARKKFKK
jgi:hypothetical protein